MTTLDDLIAHVAMPDCPCRKCRDANGDWPTVSIGNRRIRMRTMVLCPTCGNKRCPHATDHTLACTGSNESGQKGSDYE